jgi:hypothetical protein
MVVTFHENCSLAGLTTERSHCQYQYNQLSHDLKERKTLVPETLNTPIALYQQETVRLILFIPLKEFRVLNSLKEKVGIGN